MRTDTEEWIAEYLQDVKARDYDFRSPVPYSHSFRRAQNPRTTAHPVQNTPKAANPRPEGFSADLFQKPNVYAGPEHVVTLSEYSMRARAKQSRFHK